LCETSNDVDFLVGRAGMRFAKLMKDRRRILNNPFFGHLGLYYKGGFQDPMSIREASLILNIG
jgi:hypothetical protein